MKNIIKKFIGEILVTLGTGAFFYNIFNFSYRTYTKNGLRPEPPRGELEGIAYYYNNDVLMIIAIGAALTTIGILIIKNRQR